VVPQFEPVFKDLGGRLNAGAALVLTASTWLRGNVDLVLGICAVIALIVWLVLSSADRRAKIIALIGSLPGISGLMHDRRAARIISTLGLLSANGVALPIALKILRHVVTEPHYVDEVDRLNEQVRGGRRFADALADTNLLPALAVRMLRIGDETGDLSSISAHAAEFYEHRLSVGLDRLMGAVGPATIIFVSVIVGALIISIMTALLSITELAL
jgi:general secretion pathway protein F